MSATQSLHKQTFRTAWNAFIGTHPGERMDVLGKRWESMSLFQKSPFFNMVDKNAVQDKRRTPGSHKFSPDERAIGFTPLGIGSMIYPICEQKLCGIEERINELDQKWKDFFGDLFVGKDEEMDNTPPEPARCDVLYGMGRCVDDYPQHTQDVLKSLKKTAYASTKLEPDFEQSFEKPIVIYFQSRRVWCFFFFRCCTRLARSCSYLALCLAQSSSILRFQVFTGTSRDNAWRHSEN